MPVLAMKCARWAGFQLSWLVGSRIRTVFHVKQSCRDWLNEEHFTLHGLATYLMFHVKHPVCFPTDLLTTRQSLIG